MQGLLTIDINRHFSNNLRDPAQNPLIGGKKKAHCFIVSPQDNLAPLEPLAGLRLVRASP